MHACNAQNPSTRARPSRPRADPRSILFLGRPGVGKTTVIRELARTLADDCGRRVVIVDTSNEIGGDGDVPHPAVGTARRMQVPDVHQQHGVMVLPYQPSRSPLLCTAPTACAQPHALRPCIPPTYSPPISPPFKLVVRALFCRVRWE